VGVGVVEGFRKAISVRELRFGDMLFLVCQGSCVRIWVVSLCVGCVVGSCYQ
jgi:hypothetical protein